MVNEAKLVKELYDNERESLYYKYNVVNVKEVQSHQEELFQLKTYLPNLLRKVLSIEYYSRMGEYGVLDSVMETISKTRKQGREDDTVEFINWIDSHIEFYSLLNEKQVKKLGDDLENLEKLYKNSIK